MIKIRIRNDDHEIDIRFPISESELFAKLGEIHTVEGRDAAQSALVTEVYWPEEFSMLKDRFANLDELNYLGKRMESFDTLEYDQFLIGISKLDSKEVKDLINLTFNLNHFTLCQDVSNYGKMDLPHRAKSVYIYLADRANKNGECWPAIPTIARELKLSQSTVRRALQDLRKAGLLETEQRYRKHGGKSSLLYTLRQA